MIINNLTPQGYCGGVVRALKIVKDAIFDPKVKKPIYILGLIIHNKKIKEALNYYGVISLESSFSRLKMIDSIKEGTVILTAHGVSNNVRLKLKEKNLNYIDATCPAISKLHNQVKKHLNSYEVVFIGNKGHPEVEGVLGISQEIKLISNIDEAKIYNKETNKPLYIANQTTLSLYQVQTIVNELAKKYEVLFLNNICNATTLRQNAVLKQPNADLLIVVGDYLSSNTTKLKEVSLNEAKIKSYHIETIEDLNNNWFKDVKTINVTSGASTPKAITDEVINYLKQFDYNKKETHNNVSKLSYLDILK